MSKFSGAAFWQLRVQDAAWLERAYALLAPLETAGLAALRFEPSPTGGRLGVAFGPDAYAISVVNLRGNGVVRKLPSAPRFILVLMALRAQLGGLQVVDDDEAPVPARPRPTHALFKADWDGVEKLAPHLGLAPSDRFRSVHARVLRGLI
jgi:hypothetical protein